MIDRKWIGHQLPDSVLPIELSRLQFFAKVIGDADPIYTDAIAAREMGYRNLPAPPTFLFAAELDSGATFRLLGEMNIPISKLLHGEQSFIYHRPVCVGDTVTVRSVISDIYDKKNGVLEFVVKCSHAINQNGDLVAELRSVLVCRH
jgi:acyl dehydratase